MSSNGEFSIGSPLPAIQSRVRTRPADISTYRLSIFRSRRAMTESFHRFPFKKGFNGSPLYYRYPRRDGKPS